MITYQDFVKVGTDEKNIIKFCQSAIEEHKQSQMYEMAKIANDYDRQQNTTIMEYQKTLFDIQGKECYLFIALKCQNKWRKREETKCQTTRYLTKYILPKMRCRVAGTTFVPI